jgi:antitoxin FitA
MSKQARWLIMASITIRNVDKALKRELAVPAAQHGRSLQEEVHHILRAALAENTPALTNLFEAIRRHVDPPGGVELKIPRRRSKRAAPAFSDA